MLSVYRLTSVIATVCQSRGLAVQTRWSATLIEIMQFPAHRFTRTTAALLRRFSTGFSNEAVWNVYPPVAQALREGRPVVALESTIVAHGMPYPQNVLLTRQVGDILRSKGVEPATIGKIRLFYSSTSYHI